MARKNKVTAPNWLILAVILVVAGAAIFFLQQTGGTSVNNSGNVIGGAPVGSHCPVMKSCGLGFWHYFSVSGNTREEASKAALEACVLGTPGVIAEVNNCMAENQTTCLNNGDCGYYNTGPTVGPCTISNCEPTQGRPYLTPQGLPGWTDLWYCNAALRVDGSSTCTMI